MRTRLVSLSILFLAAGCPAAPGTACLTARDCVSGMVCVMGGCAPPTDASARDAGEAPDASSDAAGRDALAPDASGPDASGSDASSFDSGAHCGLGRACSGDETCCSDGCTTTTIDSLNCGECGLACGGSASCAASRCTCADGAVDCNGDLGRAGGDGCETTLGSPLSCSGCGDRCTPMHATGPACVAGSCNYAACTAGFIDCDAIRSNGCEADSSAPTTCGSCANNCLDDANVVGAFCSPSGGCGYTCASGFSDCGGGNDGCETSTRTSPFACGSCSNDCTTRPHTMSASCALGICQLVCSPGYTNCGVPSDPCVSASPSPC